MANVPFLILYLGLTLTLIWRDLRVGLLPDRFTCPLLWGGLLFNLLLYPRRLPQAVAGAALGYAGLALLYWGYRLARKREGLGYGDVKFLAALGAWHGWRALPMLIGLAAGLALLYCALRAIGGGPARALKDPLPFGPFLAAAGMVSGWQTFFSPPL